jgi:hypothetical protein
MFILFYLPDPRLKLTDKNKLTKIGLFQAKFYHLVIGWIN